MLYLRGRVPAAGRTWIGVDETGRLGADAGVVRAWLDAGSDPDVSPTHRDGSSG